MRFVVAFLCLAIPSTALAQQAVNEQLRCPECQIELEYRCTLGSSDGPGELRSIPYRGTVDSRGRLVILQPNTGDLASVFDQDCDFVQRIGREGEGPNEYGNLKYVRASGDQLLLWDAANGRLTWVSPEYEETRTRLMESQLHDVLELSDGRLVANVSIRREATSGYALHLIAADGRMLHSFDTHAILYGDATSFFRHLFPSTSGGFWSVNAYSRYSIAEWTADATEIRRFSREAYEPYGLPNYGSKSTDTPPHWRVKGGWVEGDTLWLVSRLPDERWREGVLDAEPSESEPGAAGSFPLKDMKKAYDEVLEAIDLNSGQVIARHVEDFPNLRMVLGPRMIGRWERDDLGWYHLRVYNVRFDGRQ